MHLSPYEHTMWGSSRGVKPGKLTHEEINQKYRDRELRIVTETNREQLPNFVSALGRSGWLELQPFYQRRIRWDVQRKSRLIESFIMNVPVPPCFLYESEFAKYEVMDGQQRISTISEFYQNDFALKGLEQWPELDGMHYTDLPSEVRRGLDRRSISYVVLLKESTKTRSDELLLRQQIFERLNTGGVELENQEIRHCIYHNEFERMIVQLSKHPAMREAWGLEPWTEEEDAKPSMRLLKSPHFSKMQDVEFVLRFFALRHVEHYRMGMQSFLDEYMVRSRNFNEEDVAFLKAHFHAVIELAKEIFGDNLFRPWDEKRGKWATSPQIAYADATMIAIGRNLNSGAVLVQRKADVLEAVKVMLAESPAGAFTGKKNTRLDVINRMDKFSETLASIARS